MKKITLIAVLLLYCSISYGQWQSINPGAGGQVQDVVPDPNTDGRLILASDMEGIYESVDHGESWHVKGSLHQNRAYAVAFAKGNVNKLYVGTLYGLEVSNDGGNTFTLVSGTKKKSIGAIAVDPNNENIVIAGIGWRDDYDFSNTFGLQQNANGEIYRSSDGGATWTMVNFDTDAGSDRNVFSIQFDATNGNVVYIGSGKGLFKSTDAGLTWTKINAPLGTLKNKGAALSPDGKVIYAAYTANGNNGNIYASPTSTINWQQVTAGSGVAIGAQDFWYPEVDPRSTGGEHKLTVALQNSREGLFEATFNWSGDALTTYSWKTVWKGTEGYDNGWDNASPNPRYVHYTPSNWDRAMWSTTNQTIFQGKPSGNTYTWHNKYSKPNMAIKVSQWNTEWPTYSSRGTESTYSYDIAVHDNYIVQGQGDNGAMESWDNGFSWSNIQHRLGNPPLADVQAVDIAVGNGTPMVVAQMTSGYGGNAANGSLYAKKLNSHSPDDKWLFLAGGWEWKGLPSGVLRDVAVSPVKKDRVFAYSTNQGLYMMDDIGWAYSEAEQGRNAWWAKINNGVADGIYAVKKIAPHPTNADIVYINGTLGSKQGVFKGEKIADDWVWTKLYEGSGWDSEIQVWENEGQLYLFFSGASSEVGGDGNNFIGTLSLDDGVTWKTVITKETAKGLTSPSWFDAISDDFGFRNKGGVAGYKNQIIMNYYDHRQQKTFGIYKGTIDGSGNVTWEDFTANIPFGGLTSAIVRDFQGEPYIYATTAGAGAWRRPLGASTVTMPVAPSNLAVSEILGTTVKLSWTDNATNENGFRVERKKDNTYITVATLAADDTSYADKDLNPLTAYTYRVIAFNAAGSSDYSNTIIGTTAEKIIVCENANLIPNPEFDDALNNWVLYKNTGVVATSEVVTDAGMSGGNAGKVTITTVPGTKDSDVQFYSNLPELTPGATYQVTFKAKAAAAKDIRMSVLLGAAPWTGFVSKDITLTDQSASYGPFDFTVATATTAARLDFFLGKDANDVWFDALVVQEKCGAPKAPTALVASPFSSTQIDLSWVDNSDNETGFVVQQKINDNFETVATLGANVTSNSITGLKANTAYTFRVMAKNDFGDSVYSNEVSASTTDVGACASTNLIKNNEFDTALDNWELYDNTGSSVTAEVVTDATISGANAVKITIPSVTGTSDSNIQFFQGLPTLQNGLTYQVTFTAKAAATKEIRLGVLLGQAPWTGFLSQNITLTNQVATYGPYEFTMTQNSDVARLDFFLSKDNNDIWLDAIVLKQKCAAIGPNAPSELTSTVTSSSEINLTWKDNSDDETGFIVERKSTGAFEAIATLGANITSYSDTGLVAATLYTYRVVAKNDLGNSDYSNQSTATTDAGVCGGPDLIVNGEFDSNSDNWVFYKNTGVVATQTVVTDGGLSGANSAKITITTVDGTKDSDVQFYQNLPALSTGKTYEVTFTAKAAAPKSIRVGVFLGAAPWTGFLSKDVSLTDTSTAYGPFEFTVSANTSVARIGFFLSRDNNDVWFDAIVLKEKCNTAVPNKPSDLVAKSISSSQIDLSWTDASDNETGFSIERKSNAAFEIVASVGANVKTYSDKGLNGATAYTYRVVAKNAGGNSEYSNESAATTSASSTGGCAYPNLINNGEFDTGLSGWVSYFDAAGPASGSAAPDSNGVLSGVLSTKITITTTGGTDNQVQFYQSGLPILKAGKTYELTFRAKAAATKPIRIAVLKGESPWTNFLEKNIDLSTEAKTYGPFEFTMTAESVVSQFHFFLGKDISDVWVDAIVLKEKCNVIVPNAPSALTAVAISANQIDLTWSDNSTDESGFTIERKSTGAYTEIATVSANTTSYSNMNLAAGSAYMYRIKAINTSGVSAWSNEISATTDDDNGGDAGCTNPNLLKNGEFDNGDTDWIPYNNTTGTASFKADLDSQLSGTMSVKITIEKAGAKDSDIQYYQSGLPKLKAGVTYELSFMAKATAAKPIRIAVLRGEAPWNNFLEKQVNVTTQAATYGPYEFTMTAESTVSQFHFFLGNDNSDVWVDAVSLKEKCIVTTPPAKPKNLVATAASDNQIDLKWTDSDYKETGFIIERKSSGDFEVIATVNANITGYADIGLVPLTKYTYRVSAKNGLGNSGYSNESAATTLEESGVPYDNFNIEIVGETCPGKKNGQVIVKAKKTYGFVTTINGITYNFTKDLTVDGLAPGNYEFCITIASENFKQCYNAEIVGGKNITGKSSVKKGEMSIDIDTGTSPFNVLVNGISVLITSSTSFSIGVDHGDVVQVKTEKECEGVFMETIDLIGVISAYPNPTHGKFEIELPIEKKEVIIDLYNMQSQLISSRSYPIISGKVQLNIEKESAGVYFARVLLDKPSNFKIIKQ
ncbi:fibronectin type III domain-containing protein [Mariniflexile sp.]|uniref:fibronectin type III domain-containing protein n=3 Tax=Mariniflexile sp. TaxID=1979402 RepID=UPI004048207A